MEKILSICIPVYNGGQTAYQHIKEILTYEKDDIEVIVSDNASTDNTLELLQAIADDRLKIVRHAENKGPSVNWYHALMAGTAKYVMLHQDNDRIVVKNLPQYVVFLKDVQYDVMRNCYGSSKTGEISVAQVQYYNAYYSHASYVIYRRDALHSIRPLKCSLNIKKVMYPYLIWDTQILKKYPLKEKRAYLNSDILITYTPKTYQDKPSRTAQLDVKGNPPYSYEYIKGNFILHIKMLRKLYPKDQEYSRLICYAYLHSLFKATTHFYVLMTKPEYKWMKKRYGLDKLDSRQIDYVKLNDDFFESIIAELRMRHFIQKIWLKARLKIITEYNKNNFQLLFPSGSMSRIGIKRFINTALKIWIEKACE